jgi:hypothetical protein
MTAGSVLDPLVNTSSFCHDAVTLNVSHSTLTVLHRNAQKFHHQALLSYDLINLQVHRRSAIFQSHSRIEYKWVPGSSFRVFFREHHGQEWSGSQWW